MRKITIVLILSFFFSFPVYTYVKGFDRISISRGSQNYGESTAFYLHPTESLIGQSSWFIKGRLLEIGMITATDPRLSPRLRPFTQSLIDKNAANQWLDNAANAGFEVKKDPNFKPSPGDVIIWERTDGSTICGGGIVEDVSGDDIMVTASNTVSDKKVLPANTKKVLVTDLLYKSNVDEGKVKLRKRPTTSAEPPDFKVPCFSVLNISNPPSPYKQGTNADGYIWYYLVGNDADGNYVKGWAAFKNGSDVQGGSGVKSLVTHTFTDLFDEPVSINDLTPPRKPIGFVHFKSVDELKADFTKPLESSSVSSPVDVEVKIEGDYSSLEYSLDGKPISFSNQIKFQLNTSPGNHTLKVTVKNSSGKEVSSERKFTVVTKSINLEVNQSTFNNINPSDALTVNISANTSNFTGQITFSLVGFPPELEYSFKNNVTQFSISPTAPISTSITITKKDKNNDGSFSFKILAENLTERIERDQEIYITYKKIISNCDDSLNIGVNNWKGVFYDNTSLSGTPKMIVDCGSTDNLMLNFGTESPAKYFNKQCQVPSDLFSATFTRKYEITEDGKYKISVKTDDGYNLFIDNVHIKGAFKDVIEEDVFEYDLKKGVKEIKLEYKEMYGDSNVSFSISKDQTPPNNDIVEFISPVKGFEWQIGSKPEVRWKWKTIPDDFKGKGNIYINIYKLDGTKIDLGLPKDNINGIQALPYDFTNITQETVTIPNLSVGFYKIGITLKVNNVHSSPTLSEEIKITREPCLNLCTWISSPPNKIPLIFVNGYTGEEKGMDNTIKYIDKKSLFSIYTPYIYTYCSEPTILQTNDDIDYVGKNLEEALKKHSIQNKYIYIISHSMGGLISRVALQKTNIGNNIIRLITLGTPHHGSQASDSLIEFFKTQLIVDISSNFAKQLKYDGYDNFLYSNPWLADLNGLNNNPTPLLKHVYAYGSHNSKIRHPLLYLTSAILKNHLIFDDDAVVPYNSAILKGNSKYNPQLGARRELSGLDHFDLTELPDEKESDLLKNHLIWDLTTPLDSISKTSGRTGDIVTIKGHGFGDYSAGSVVMFGNNEAESVVNWSDTEITVKVPKSQQLGDVKVKLIPGGSGNPSNELTFNYNDNNSTFSISGVAVNQSQMPLANINIEVASLDGGFSPSGVFTDVAGQFKINGFLEGKAYKIFPVINNKATDPDSFEFNKDSSNKLFIFTINQGSFIQPPVIQGQFNKNDIFLRKNIVVSQIPLTIKAEVSDPSTSLEISLCRKDSLESPLDELLPRRLSQDSVEKLKSVDIIPPPGFKNFYWKVRAIDKSGNFSQWVYFGNNPSIPDFVVDQNIKISKVVVDGGGIVSLKACKKHVFKAIAYDSNGTSLSISDFEFTSSPGNIDLKTGEMLIDDSYNECFISATAFGVTGTLQVKTLPEYSIDIKEKNISLPLFGSIKLTPIIKDCDDNIIQKDVFWSVHPPSFGSCLNGLFKSSGEKGVGIITAISIKGIKAQVFVKVEGYILSTIKIDPQDIALLSGDSFEFKATCMDSFGNVIKDVDLQWDVHSQDFGIINKLGQFKAIKEGQCIITATADGISAFAGVNITKVKDIKMSQSGYAEIDCYDTYPVYATAYGLNDVPIASADIRYYVEPKERGEYLVKERKFKAFGNPGECLLIASFGNRAVSTKFRVKDCTQDDDKDQPLITLISPKATFIEKGKTSIELNIVDQSSLEFVEINGIKASMNQKGTWSAEVDIKQGLNTLNVVAQDNSKNKNQGHLVIEKVGTEHRMLEATLNSKKGILQINKGPKEDVNFTTFPEIKTDKILGDKLFISFRDIGQFLFGGVVNYNNITKNSTIIIERSDSSKCIIQTNINNLSYYTVEVIPGVNSPQGLVRPKIKRQFIAKPYISNKEGNKGRIMMPMREMVEESFDEYKKVEYDPKTKKATFYYLR